MPRTLPRRHGAVLLLCFTGLFAAPAIADSGDDEDPVVSYRHGGGVAIFHDLHVKADEVRRGDVVCIFGNLTIDGEVRGNVVAIGGGLNVTGTVRGDTVAVLSGVNAGPGASFGHDLTVVLGGIEGDPEVRGDLLHIPSPVGLRGMRFPFGVLGALVAWGALLYTTLIFFFLLLFAAAAPRRVRLLGEEAALHYLRAWLFGIAGYGGMLLVTGALAATILGIPIAGVLYLAFLVLKWLGIAGICHRLGTAIGKGAGRELSLLGSILVGFLPYAVLVLLPLFLGGLGFAIAIGVRLLFWLTVEIPAVGLVLLTRAGGRPAASAPLPSPPPVVLAPAPSLGGE
jgi:hypothetical protein